MSKTKDGYIISPCENEYVSYRNLSTLCKKQNKEIKRLNKLIDQLKNKLN